MLSWKTSPKCASRNCRCAQAGISRLGLDGVAQLKVFKNRKLTSGRDRRTWLVPRLDCLQATSWRPCETRSNFGSVLIDRRADRETVRARVLFSSPRSTSLPSLIAFGMCSDTTMRWITSSLKRSWSRSDPVATRWIIGRNALFDGPTRNHGLDTLHLRGGFSRLGSPLKGLHFYLLTAR